MDECNCTGILTAPIHTQAEEAGHVELAWFGMGMEILPKVVTFGPYLHMPVDAAIDVI